MLRELTIRNLAVIEEATFSLGSGLSCITGETGAGKSLLVAALEILLGLRRPGGLVREGATEAVIEAIFDDPEPLAIRRTIPRSGRSTVEIDGRPARPADVRGLARRLVEIHGERSPFLERPAEALDRYAGSGEIRERYEADLALLARARTRADELEASAEERRRRLETLAGQADEIDAARPDRAEFEGLEARRQILSHLERIRSEAGRAHEGLYEADGSVVERVAGILAILRELATIDAELTGLAAEVESAEAQLRDAAFVLGGYLARLDHDPLELERIEDRLDELDGLVGRYAPWSRAEGSMEAVLEIRANIERELERLRDDDRSLESIGSDLRPLQARLEKTARALLSHRRTSAERLARSIEAELAELGIPEARMSFEVEDLSRVAVLVQPNPDQPLLPLDEVASGGERSRLFLAMRSILAGSDGVGTLVFDEIDSAIGGRLGPVVGRKLRRLAHDRQVVLVTHLPQIAAWADHHLKVVKEREGGRTRTRVEAVRGEARVLELAEMIGGPEAGETSRRQALELLERAGSEGSPCRARP